MKPVCERFASGLRAVFCPSSTAPVVAFQVWVGVGSADEGPGEEGLAHVFEHMLFKGTERREVGAITRDVERAGGQINAWTSHDETVFYITLPRRSWREALDILADAIRHPAIDPEELRRELAVIREEIRMGQDSPERVATEKLFETAFRRHPYGRPVIGYDRTVRRFTRNQVIAFHRRWYVPDNLVLVISGDFPLEEMRQAVAEAFGGMERRRVPRRTARVSEPAQGAMRFFAGAQPIAEAHLSIGFPVPGLEHRDTPALDLLAAILGQGASARFETVIRRRLALVSGIRAIAYTPKDAGLFGIFATAPPRHLERATAAVFDEIRKVRSEPVSLAELTKARTMIESDKLYSEETVDGVARKVGYHALHTGDLEFEKRYMAALFALEPEDLSEVADRYLCREAANLAVIVPAARKGRGRKVDTRRIVRHIRARIAPDRAPRRAAVSTRGSTVVKALSSGDLLLVRRDPDCKLVAARAAFFGGLRQEPGKASGLAALLATTLTRGTVRRSADAVSSGMDALACSINGFAGRNTHGVRGEFLARNFEDGFALLAECLRSPSFPAAEVDREKELLIEEARVNETNPSHKAFALFHEALFGRHPYSRPIGGTERSLASLSPGALGRFLAATTGPGSMVLAVVGGVDPDAVAELAERHIVDGSSRPAKPLGTPASWSPPARAKRVLRSMPKEQSHIVVGFPGTTITGEDRFEVEVLTEILGGHGGRLFEGVRERQGLAYAVTALSMEGIEPGYIALYAGTSPGLEGRVVGAMLEELERIRSDGPTAAEMRRVKSHLIGGKAIAWQRASTRAASMALDQLYGNGHDAGDRYPARIASVSADAVREAARAYFDTGKPIITCVGPDAERLRL